MNFDVDSTTSYISINISKYVIPLLIPTKTPLLSTTLPTLFEHKADLVELVREDTVGAEVIFSQGLAAHLKLDHQGIKRPLELADVALYGGCQVLKHFVRQDKVVRGRLGAHNGQARLVVGRGHAHYHPRAKAAFEPILEVLYDVWVLIRGKYQLLVVVVQVVKQMEEFLLNLVAPSQKLDVVHYKQVILPVLFLKALHFARLQTGNIVH